MHREEIRAERFHILIFGTRLVAACEPFVRVKDVERECQLSINQGGTAGVPVPMGLEFRLFILIGNLNLLTL